MDMAQDVNEHLSQQHTKLRARVSFFEFEDVLSFLLRDNDNLSYKSHQMESREETRHAREDQRNVSTQF
jgi:hypothetical protein